MTEVTRSEQAGAAAPSSERLVNLTEHEVFLDAVHQPADEEHGLPEPSVIRVPPAGQFARLDEDRARLGEGWLVTAADRVRLTRLRRSRRVMDLPGPVPGTRYVVSRLTADAARDRSDLVFPLSEIRDDAGRVVGARGLGVYRPTMAVAERFRDWRARAWERRLRRSLPEDWLTGVLFAVATALLSAALALLPGALDNARAHGWAGGGQAWTAWLTVAFLALGVLSLGLAGRRWLIRQRMLGQRGTAYVVDEQAIYWLPEEKKSVLATISAGFQRTLLVPGPAMLGDDWNWQADASGAPQWEARTVQLVRSFWAVHYNDNHLTRNALFVWAPWPVAMAFGARATALRRGLVLHVRQRPSSGPTGLRDELRLEDSAHDFRDTRELPALEDVAPQHHLVKTDDVHLTVTLQPLPGPDPPVFTEQGRQRVEALAGSPARADTGRAGEPKLLLLLVRFAEQQIGPIPADLRQAADICLRVSGSLAASVLPPGPYRIPVSEWRLAAEDRSQVPWPAFPAVAQSIARWAEKQAEEHRGHVILLAARMPQEIAVGVGIQLGRRYTTWPEHVYPVHYAGDHLVVPDLDLGRHSVAPERAQGG